MDNDNFNSTSPNHSQNHSPNNSQNHSRNHSRDNSPNHSQNHDNQDMNLEPQNNQSPPSDNIMPLENKSNNMNSIPERNDLSNENSEENDENKKKQVKRRSKREAEGRNYVCKMCSKATYLIRLYTPIINKSITQIIVREEVEEDLKKKITKEKMKKIIIIRQTRPFL